jgi:hypothetical protein
MTQPVEPPATSLTAGILSYLVPGLGQIVQGRIGKGLLFFVLLTSLFHVGEAMGDWKNVYLPSREPPGGQPGKLNPVGALYQRLHFLGQFWIGVAAWPAVWHYLEMPPPTWVPEQYKTYQRTPDERVVNDFIVASDKTPDLGLIYTVIAGVLNILVIYDAFAGPAFPPPKKEKPREGATT